MGRYPAISGCPCHLCEPDRLDDPEDKDCVQTVYRHGWQVVAVGPGDTDGEPPFAYTVGLVHRTGHPELVITGLGTALMHQVLNDVARRVMQGQRFASGDLVEGALAHVPLLVQQLSDYGLEESVVWSRWLHRLDVPGLQLIWPDTQGIFAWQPAAAPYMAHGQPPSWRRPVPLTGAVAVDPPWPLPVPAEAGGHSCTRVVYDGEPVLLVVHNRGQDGLDDWRFLCGRGHASAEWRLSHVSHVVRSNPSIREVADLGVDVQAERPAPGLPWQRSAHADDI